MFENIDLSQDLPRVLTQADSNIEARSKRPPIFDQLVYSADIRRLNLEGVRLAMIAAGINMAGRTSEELLGVAHQVRLKLVCATPAERRASEEWLRAHNLPIR